MPMVERGRLLRGEGLRFVTTLFRTPFVHNLKAAHVRRRRSFFVVNKTSKEIA